MTPEERRRILAAISPFCGPGKLLSSWTEGAEEVSSADPEDMANAESYEVFVDRDEMDALRALRDELAGEDEATGQDAVL